MVSVESNPSWADWVGRELDARDLRKNVDLRLTDAVGEAYASIIRSCGTQFDLVIIDGQYRLECFAAVVGAVKADGVIVVDNADRADLQPFLAGWSSRLIRACDNGLSRTSFYRGAEHS
jgi:predicted O-methyltransferase YrrM